MQFTFLAAACLALSINVKDDGVFFRENENSIVSDPLVPCKGYRGQFDVKAVHLTPYPVQAGAPLIISVAGYLKEKIRKGARVYLSAKKESANESYKFTQETDFCAEVAKNGQNCPILPSVNKTTLYAGQNIPSQLAPGSYNLEVHVTNFDGFDVACMAGNVTVVKKQN